MPPLQPAGVPSFQGCVETTGDALRLIQAARNGIIPRIVRRLNEMERRSMIRSGAVFVFNVEESNIRRWTEGLQWSPSRILGNFLVYREVTERGSNRGASQREGGDSSQRADINANIKPDGLTKKTITVKIEGSDHHLISYYKPEDVRSGRLQRPVTRPDIMALEIPPDLVQSTNFRYPPKIEAGPDGRLTQIRDSDEVDQLTEGSPSTTHRSPRSPPMREYSVPISDSPTRSPTRSPEFQYDPSPSTSQRYAYPMLPPPTSPVVASTIPPHYYVPSSPNQQEGPSWTSEMSPYDAHQGPSFSYQYPQDASQGSYQAGATHERHLWTSTRRSSGVAEYQRTNIEGHAFGGQGSDMGWGVECLRQGQPPTPSDPTTMTSPRSPTMMRRQDHTRTRSVPSTSNTWPEEHHGSVQVHSPQMYHAESPPRGEYPPSSSRMNPYEGSGGSGQRS